MLNSVFNEIVVLNGYNLPATDYWFTVEYMEETVSKLFKAHFSLIR